jgi:uncharacterized membrane protein
MADGWKSNKSFIFLLIGLCIFLFIALIANVPYLIFIEKILQNGEITGWYSNPKIHLIRGVLYGVAAIISFVAILLGIRRMRILGKSYRHSSIVIIGVSTCILFLMLNFYINNKLDQVYKGFFETNIIAKLENTLTDSDLTSKQRALIERQLAIEIYVNENRQITITDENGRKFLFNPSEKDLAYKEGYSTFKKAILKDIKTAKKGMILWSSILFSSILLGRYLPIRKSHKVD